MLAKVLDLPEKTRTRLAQKAIANVRANFSKQDMCRKTIEVYKEILDQRAGG